MAFSTNANPKKAEASQGSLPPCLAADYFVHEHLTAAGLVVNAEKMS